MAKKKAVKKKVKKYNTGGKKGKVRKPETAADKLIKRRLNKDPLRKAKKGKSYLA